MRILRAGGDGGWKRRMWAVRAKGDSGQRAQLGQRPGWGGRAVQLLAWHGIVGCFRDPQLLALSVAGDPDPGQVPGTLDLLFLGAHEGSVVVVSLAPAPQPGLVWDRGFTQSQVSCSFGVQRTGLG